MDELKEAIMTLVNEQRMRPVRHELHGAGIASSPRVRETRRHVAAETRFFARMPRIWRNGGKHSVHTVPRRRAGIIIKVLAR